MGENGNGKWQLAFWIITALCGVWLLALTNGVVANDRINSAEHTDLRKLVYSELTSINTRLARMEAKLER